MIRDFSEEKKEEIFRILDEIDMKDWKPFMEWCGSRVEEFGDWPEKLGISAYTRYVDEYHQKILDLNEMTRQQVNTVFENVAEIDARYAKRMRECQEKIKEQIAMVRTMSEFMQSMTDGNPNMALLNGESVNKNCVKKIDEFSDEMRRMNLWMKGRFSDYVQKWDGERLQDNNYDIDPVIKGSEILNRYLRSRLDAVGQCVYEGKVDEIIAIINRYYPWMLSSLYVTDCYSTYDFKIVLEHVMEIVDILNQHEKLIYYLKKIGKSEEFIIHMLIELKDQYPEFYNRINQSDIDEIMIYCRYVEMNDMVAVACEEVGKERGIETTDGTDYLNDVYYNDWYYGRDISDPNYAWCSVFVLWCANEVNLLDGELFPTYEEARSGYFEGVANLKNYFGNRYHSYEKDPGYIPCVGDFVFMQSEKGQNHVGIVVGYDNENNIIYTVEGNSGQKVSFRIRNWDGSYVKGLVSNGGDVANIPENIEDFENGNNSSTR